MSIKTILAGLSGGSANRGVVDLACRLALRFQAHLQGLHIRIDATELVIAAGAEGLTAATEQHLARELSHDAADKAHHVRDAFISAAATHGLTQGGPDSTPPDLSWLELAGDGPALVSRHARFFDLVVLGRSERVVDQPHTDAIEETLLRSGRPVLLAPAEPPPTIGETIAIGWNGSDAAVRALVGALPFLRQARQVILLTVGDASQADGIPEISAYLHRHGIEASTRSAGRLAGESVGGGLLISARDAGADLLVMGGYGRSRLRESLFGGATRDLLARSRLPLLMAH